MSNVDKKNLRESNFELMRIISMLLIVIGHVFSWGGITSKSTPFLQNYIYAIYAIMIVHVNSFILVSGYFQSQSKKFKYKKVFQLLFYVWFYNLLISLIGMKVGWFEIPKENIINLIIPFKFSSHWFIYVYVFLYCLTPYLNEIINNISQKKYRELLIVSFVFCSIMPTFFIGNFNYFSRGFSIINFVFMYMIGGYIRKYYDSIKLKKLIYLLPIMLIPMAINYTLYRVKLFEYTKFVSYNNPFVVISSVAYFLIFSIMKFKSRIINILSKHTLEVYIISEMPFFRSVLYTSLGLTLAEYTSRKILLYAFALTFIIYLGGTVVAYIREFIFNLIKKPFSKLKLPFVNKNKRNCLIFLQK